MERSFTGLSAVQHILMAQHKGSRIPLKSSLWALISPHSAPVTFSRFSPVQPLSVAGDLLWRAAGEGEGAETGPAGWRWGGEACQRRQGKSRINDGQTSWSTAPSHSSILGLVNWNRLQQPVSTSAGHEPVFLFSASCLSEARQYFELWNISISALAVDNGNILWHEPTDGAFCICILSERKIVWQIIGLLNIL